MGSSHDLLDRLKAAERSLSEERMPHAGARRVAKRIARELEREARPSRMGGIPMLTFVAGAALVLLFFHWRADGGTQASVSEAEQPAMRVLVTGQACRSLSEKTTKVWGACSLLTTGPSMKIDTIEASHLEVDGRVLHLRAGSALFDVEKVRGEPVRVLIPQGEIVVVGTRFRVVVGEHRSAVELYEGRLEFHDRSGEVTPILAGQLVEFGGPEESVEHHAAGPPPQVSPRSVAQRPQAPRKSTPKRSARPATDRPAMERDAGPVIEAVERLRRQGRYAEAAATVRAALKRRWPARTADVLSYELGRLLERRIRDQASACTHWRKHLKRFEQTRYRARIERSLSELGCE